MKTRCALCGRLTFHPAVFVGVEPIGPKCARRAGLLDPKLKLKKPALGMTRHRSQAQRDGATGDLFEGVQ